MRFEKNLDMFRESLRQQNHSEQTVVTYWWSIKQFLNFLETSYPRITSLEKITKEIVLDFSNYLANYRTRKGSPLANKSQCLKLRALRKFFVFLVKQDLVLKDPTSVLTYPKEEQRLTRNILSEKEVMDLLRSSEPRNPLSNRNRAIIELLYACGIRTSELCNLKVQDVDLKEQTVIIVKGKGNKSRVLPIGQYASYYVGLYIEKARKHMLKGKRDDPGYLFLSQRGRPFNKTTINKCVMRSIALKGRLGKTISCYTFRHYAEYRIMPNCKSKSLYVYT